MELKLGKLYKVKRWGQEIIVKYDRVFDGPYGKVMLVSPPRHYGNPGYAIGDICDLDDQKFLECGVLSIIEEL